MILWERNRRQMKRLTLLLFVVVCVQCGMGFAEETPLFLRVSGHLTAADGLTDRGLDSVNQVLGRMSLRLSAFDDGEKVSLFIDDRDMWQVETWVDGDGNHALFSGTTDYVTGDGRENALAYLAGAQSPAFPLQMAKPASPENAFYDGLGVRPAVRKQTVAVENAGACPGYDLYTLSGEEWQAGWRSLTENLAPLFLEGDEGLELLGQAVFTGNVQVSRLKDAKGADMGIRVSGQGQAGENISLLLGDTPGKGGSLKVSLRPRAGKDAVNLQVQWKETVRDGKETGRFSWKYTFTRQGETKNRTAESSWTVTTENDACLVDARMELKPEDGTAWTVETKGTKTQNGFQGQVTVTGNKKKTTLVKALLQVTAGHAGERQMPIPAKTVLLQDKSETEIRLALWEEELVLMRALKYLLGGLEDESRWLLTHELRPAQWHEDPSVPPVQAEDGLIIEEDE